MHEYSLKSNSHILQVKDGVLYGFVGEQGANPIMTVYDGTQWKDTVVAQVKDFYSPSMEIVEGVAALTYLDSASNQVIMLRETEGGFETCYENSGSNLILSLIHI